MEDIVTKWWEVDDDKVEYCPVKHGSILLYSDSILFQGLLLHLPQIDRLLWLYGEGRSVRWHSSSCSKWYHNGGRLSRLSMFDIWTYCAYCAYVDVVMVELATHRGLYEWYWGRCHRFVSSIMLRHRYISNRKSVVHHWRRTSRTDKAYFVLVELLWLPAAWW